MFLFNPSTNLYKDISLLIIIMKYKQKRTTKKRTYKKKFSSKNKSRTATIGGSAGYGITKSPFPSVLWCPLSYSETFTLLQTLSGTPIVRTYAANGMFDPRVALGGGQPRYYDSLLGNNDTTAPYRFYRVHASAIKATIWPNQGNANSANCLISLIPRRRNITSPSTIDEQRERPYSKHIAMTTTGSYKPRVVKNFCKIKTHLGHKDLMDVDATAARYDQNPFELVDWDVVLTDVQGSAPASATIQVTITYFAQFYSLSDVADS